MGYSSGFLALSPLAIWLVGGYDSMGAVITQTTIRGKR